MPNPSDVSVTGVSSGVDWISATLGREEIDNQSWLYDSLHALEKIAMAGNVYKRRSLLGFDGWESAGCFVGSNDKMHYVQFAGHWANDAYPMIEHPKVHVSRIDLQVTVQYSEELLDEGKQQYGNAIDYNSLLPEGRKRKVYLFIGSDGGDTVYVGAPSSEQRGRVYNKDKQSGDNAFKRSWRYESVYRNHYALVVFFKLITSVLPPPDFIVSTVVEFYRQRGIGIRGLDDWSGTVIEAPRRANTDVSTKLRWIKEQVAPTIRKLAEMGYAEELMDVIAEAIAAGRNEQT